MAKIIVTFMTIFSLDSSLQPMASAQNDERATSRHSDDEAE
jgi:hypothetical protein